MQSVTTLTKNRGLTKHGKASQHLKTRKLPFVRSRLQLSIPSGSFRMTGGSRKRRRSKAMPPQDKEFLLSRPCHLWTNTFHFASSKLKDFLYEIPQHPIKSWMSLPPSVEETPEAIKQMKRNKAAGPESIPAELIQHGGECILSQLHLLFLSMWESKTVPQDLLDVSIMTIFKKGYCSACGNYRGISLLSITGNIFARVLYKRLHDLN